MSEKKKGKGIQERAQVKHLPKIAKTTLNIPSSLAEAERFSKYKIGDHIVGEVFAPNGEITFLASLRKVLVESSDEIIDNSVKVLFILERSSHAVILGNCTTTSGMDRDVALNGQIEVSIGKSNIVPVDETISNLTGEMKDQGGSHVTLGVSLIAVGINFRHNFGVPDRNLIRSNADDVAILSVEIGQVVVIIAPADRIPKSVQRRARSKPRARNILKRSVVSNTVHSLGQPN